MNKDILIGNWKQLKGEAQKKWGKLTNDDLDQLDGDREKLMGLLQESYGKSREQAEQDIKDWEKSMAA
jgi:uncharacterized protein YjbJ (UPF0337 family)|tara:strand:- start:764 stop:967 length:204 start_codon:yes stop_codon:yes gene_type:complete